MTHQHPPSRRATWQREAVRENILTRHDHPTAHEVHASLNLTGIGLATVYRHLAVLVTEGAVRTVVHEGETRYDRNTDPHAHASCTSCGALWDVPLPEHIAEHRPDGLEKVAGVQLTYAGRCCHCP